MVNPFLAWSADENYQIVKSGQFQGLANDLGEIIIPPVYDALGWSDGSVSVHADLIGYFEDDHWGLISIKNKKITRPQFTILLAHDAQRIKAAIKGKFSNHLFYGLLDEKGEVIIPFNYFSIDQFDSDLLLISEYRERATFYGLIASTGKTVLPAAYSEISHIGNLLLGRRDSKMKIFDLQGNSIFEFWLDEVSAQDEGFLVKREGRYGFVNADGTIRNEVTFKKIEGALIQKFNEWKIINIQDKDETIISSDSLTQNENDTWIAHVNNAEHLLSQSTARLFDNQENQLIDTFEGFFLMQNQSTLKWNVFKETGEAILLNKDFIKLDSGFMFVLHQDRWDIYNYFGRQINERSVGKILGIQMGLIAVRNNGYWGWMDFNGNLTVRYKYDQLKFGASSDQFIMQYVGKWGVADFNDDIIISPDYDKVEEVAGFYVCHKGQHKKIIDVDGQIIYHTTGEIFEKQMLLVQEDSLVGAVLPSGFIIEPAYDSIKVISGFFKLRKGAYVSLIDSLGLEIISFSDELQDIVEYSDNWFLVKKDQSFGFIDSEGRLRIANRYDAARMFADDMAAIQLIGKWGFIDRNEKLKVQPFYDEVSDFRDGLAKVRIEDKCGIIDSEGREVIGLEWKSIQRQPTGNFVVEDFQNRFGLVNMEGEMILSPIFESMEDTPGSLVIVGKFGKKGVLDYQGFSKYSFKYDDIQIKGDFVLLLEVSQN